MPFLFFLEFFIFAVRDVRHLWLGRKILIFYRVGASAIASLYLVRVAHAPPLPRCGAEENPARWNVCTIYLCLLSTCVLRLGRCSRRRAARSGAWTRLRWRARWACWVREPRARLFYGCDGWTDPCIEKKEGHLEHLSAFLCLSVASLLFSAFLHLLRGYCRVQAIFSQPPASSLPSALLSPPFLSLLSRVLPFHALAGASTRGLSRHLYSGTFVSASPALCAVLLQHRVRRRYATLRTRGRCSAVNSGAGSLWLQRLPVLTLASSLAPFWSSHPPASFSSALARITIRLEGPSLRCGLRRVAFPSGVLLPFWTSCLLSVSLPLCVSALYILTCLLCLRLRPSFICRRCLLSSARTCAGLTLLYCLRFHLPGCCPLFGLSLPLPLLSSSVLQRRDVPVLWSGGCTAFLPLPPPLVPVGISACHLLPPLFVFCLCLSLFCACCIGRTDSRGSAAFSPSLSPYPLPACFSPPLPAFFSTISLCLCFPTLLGKSGKDYLSSVGGLAVSPTVSSADGFVVPATGFVGAAGRVSPMSMPALHRDARRGARGTILLNGA